MINNIIVHPADNVSILTEYFDFNQIPYDLLDLWSTENDQFGGYQILNKLASAENTLLVMNHLVFQSMMDWNISKEQLIQFSKKNQIWVWNDIDGILMSEKNVDIDAQLANITVFVDGPFITPIKNLNIQPFPASFFLKMQRIKTGITDKTSCKYDFLLTTIAKPGREHRDILLKELNERSVKSAGLIVQKTMDRPGPLPTDQKNSSWVGEKNPHHHFQEGHPSMDLYRQCWFEIVPETLHWSGHFYTEKTNKPINTKTPFLTVSTKGYLEYLKSLGFQTFGSLIDESYDQQDAIEDRIRLMLNQVEDIVTNGSESFYNSAKPIVDYNYNLLAEFTGKWNHLTDAFITRHLEQVGFKL